MDDSSNSDHELAQKARDGDREAASQLVARYRDRLVKMVRLRMDRRLSKRVDASDIVQEATLDAVQRFEQYLKKPDVDLFVWLRWIANDKLIDAHRFHLGTQKRQLGQEVSIFARPVAEATSFALAEHLLGRLTSPTAALRAIETRSELENALNQLEPVDREVLVLRHFEHLSNKETAEVLGLKKSGASRRYVEALKRLKELLKDVPAFEEFFGAS
ncbi:MAG: sigma-70 family RNA polymerase sigma factor [Planctomycetota bacterium]